MVQVNVVAVVKTGGITDQTIGTMVRIRFITAEIKITVVEAVVMVVVEIRMVVVVTNSGIMVRIGTMDKIGKVRIKTFFLTLI